MAMEAPRAGADPFEIVMRPDGIAIMRWLVPSSVTLEVANGILLAYERVTGGRPVPVLVDAANSKGVDRESRTRFRQAPSPLAVALLVKSPFSRFLANLFIGLDKSEYPIRLFNVEADAVAWLRGFLK